MEFVKLSQEESKKIRKALDANVFEGKPLQMEPSDTSFILDAEDIEQQLINTIQSIPCHY